MNNELKDISNQQEPTRFILKGGKSINHRMKAYEMMDELNKIEEPYEKDGKKYKIHHRVGVTTYSQLILDIDNKDEKNLAKVLANLHMIFTNDSYTVIKTCHSDPNKFGYQIISNIKEVSSFGYKHLKVLNVCLEREYFAINDYKDKLEKFLNDFRKEYPNPPKNLFNELLLKSGLINPVGDIDYLYNVLAAIKGKVCIRLSPKTDGDKWVVLK